MANPDTAYSTGTGTGNIESWTPDERKSGSFSPYQSMLTPNTIAANTNDTTGRRLINGFRGLGEATAHAPEAFEQFLHDADTQVSNILEEGFTGRPEPRLSDKETDEQYDARVWPLKRMWDASMKTIDDIADGRASDRLRRYAFGTVMTAMSGPMMIVPLAEGAGALVARSGTRAAAAGTAAGVARSAGTTAGRPGLVARVAARTGEAYRVVTAPFRAAYQVVTAPVRVVAATKAGRAVSKGYHATMSGLDKAIESRPGASSAGCTRWSRSPRARS